MGLRKAKQVINFREIVQQREAEEQETHLWEEMRPSFYGTER